MNYWFDEFYRAVAARNLKSPKSHAAPQKSPKANHLFDEIARATGTLPRREAFNRIFWLLAGGGLVTQRAMAAQVGCGEACGSGGNQCGAANATCVNSVCTCGTNFCCCASTKMCVSSTGAGGANCKSC